MPPSPTSMASPFVKNKFRSSTWASLSSSLFGSSASLSPQFHCPLKKKNEKDEEREYVDFNNSSQSQVNPPIANKAWTIVFFSYLFYKSEALLSNFISHHYFLSFVQILCKSFVSQCLFCMKYLNTHSFDSSNFNLHLQNSLSTGSYKLQHNLRNYMSV